jgi:subtilisin family serine protease
MKAGVLVGLLLAAAVGYAQNPGATQRPGGDRPSSSKQKIRPRPAYAPDQVLVRFRSGVDEQMAAAVHRGIGASVKRQFRSVSGLALVQLPSGLAVRQAIRKYREHPQVLYAEPDYIVRALDTPNDPQFGSLWGLHNTGQTVGEIAGTPDADIDAPEAWDITTGSSSVVIGIIDTGIEYTHSDLGANVFRNESECTANGIDDDGNGYVDDCYGIDTFNHDSDPMDDHFHGTHVAGTIGAIRDLPDGDWRRVQKADGYNYLIVNGQVTFEDGKCTGALPGKMLRSYDMAG